MHIRSKHVQQWIRTGYAIVVTEDVTAQFGLHLEELPWLPSGSGLDWTRLKGLATDLSRIDAPHLTNWLAHMPLGGDPYWVFWYSSEEPGIACEKAFAASHLSEAFWTAPGKRYVFGAAMQDGKLVPSFGHFAEYDGTDALIAAL
jgi:hypothetical protein